MVTKVSVGVYVEAPPLAGAPYGLINSQTLVPDVERWEGGVSYESLACAAKIETWGLCDPNPFPVVDPTGEDRIVHAIPFGISASDLCTSTLGSRRRELAEERVLAMLDAGTQKAVESELAWGHWAALGDVGGTEFGRWLASPQTDILNGGAAVSADHAVSLLLDAYAGCSTGGSGVLHLTRGTASQLDLHPDGDVLRDELETLVIAGSGYVAPTPPIAGWDGTWAWITGPTSVWLGEPTVIPGTFPEAINIATNDIFLKAERMAAVTFDGCCAFAVKVDLALTTV